MRWICARMSFSVRIGIKSNKYVLAGIRHENVIIAIFFVVLFVAYVRVFIGFYAQHCIVQHQTMVDAFYGVYSIVRWTLSCRE